MFDFKLVAFVACILVASSHAVHGRRIAPSRKCPPPESPRSSARTDRASSFLPASCGRVPLGTPYVAGGLTAEPGDYPPYVRVDIITNRFRSLCGGTLISDRHVLTAAHCFVRGARFQVVPTIYATHVAMGKSGGVPENVYPTAKACKHPKFDFSLFQYDIAVLTLAKPVKFDNLTQPACLPNEPLKETKWLRAVGLGAVDDVNMADQLQALPVKWETCDSGDIHQSRICFVPSTDKGDTCKGDSGGPIFGLENGRLTVYGATSYGPDVCAEQVKGKSVNADVFNLRKEILDLIQTCV